MNSAFPRITATNQVSQISFVTRHFEKTIKEWARITGAGPFFCGDFALENYYYRGKTSSCRTTVGLGFLGDMQIQIVTQNDNNPSIYKEILDRNPHGDAFHHILALTDDIDGDLERYKKLGVELASYVEIKGMRVAFFDTIGQLGFMMEYFQRTQFHDQWFRQIHQAHLNWDGKDPIQSHPLG